MLHSRGLYLVAGIAYLLFVVYGSLVPLAFHPRPLDVALRDFLHIRYLQLGPESRADWVANLLLYIPLAYLWLGFVSREGRIFRQVFFSLVIFSICVALSISVEFAQLFFPPRTVSLNDIIAEVLGTGVGIVLFWFSGNKTRTLVESLLSQGRRAAYASLLLYAFAYFAFSLFPYDFVISAGEIRAKLAGDFFHWFPSRTSCGNTLRCGAKLAAEAAVAAPVGVLIGLVSQLSRGTVVTLAASIGLVLGVIIEALQFFLVSGITLGVSVFTRIMGVAVGAAAAASWRSVSLWPLLYFLRPYMPITGATYVALLAAVTWLGKGPVLPVQQALGRLGEIYFMPFYYHYYTSESAAMASLLAATIMSLPISVQFWIWRVTQMREFVGRGALQAGFLSGIITSGLEFGKLFFSAARPDPTNIIIAAAASAVGFLCLSISTRSHLSLDFMEDNGDRRYAN